MKLFEDLFEPFNENKEKFHKKIYKTKNVDCFIQNIFDRIEKQNKTEIKVVFKKKKFTNL